jgi:hypothetical protein
MPDAELRVVLELATDEELMEIEEILYGTRFDRFALLCFAECLPSNSLKKNFALILHKAKPSNRVLLQNWLSNFH